MIEMIQKPNIWLTRILFERNSVAVDDLNGITDDLALVNFGYYLAKHQRLSLISALNWLDWSDPRSITEPKGAHLQEKSGLETFVFKINLNII